MGPESEPEFPAGVNGPPPVSQALPPIIASSSQSPENVCEEIPCRVGTDSAVLRVTDRRLVIIRQTNENQEVWACPLQDLTQVLSVGAEKSVSVVLITRAPAVKGAIAQSASTVYMNYYKGTVGPLAPFFDVTGRFPCVTMWAEAASRLGALIIDQLEGGSDATQESSNTNLAPVILGANETLGRHFNLGEGCDIWLTTRRLIYRRAFPRGSEASSVVLAIASPDQTVTTTELREAFTWEVSLSDINGVEQHSVNTEAGLIRYVVPISNSRSGDTDIVWTHGLQPSIGHGGLLGEMTGPPRPATRPGDNAQWFGLLAVPAVGPDGDTLWSGLGPLLAYLLAGGDDADPEGSVGSEVNRLSSAQAFSTLGEVVKKFEAPAPKEAPHHSGGLIISRRGLTLWREAKIKRLSVQSVWHFFLSQETSKIPRICLNHVPVPTGRAIDLKGVVSVLGLAIPTCGLALLLLPFVLWPTQRPARELPALGLPSGGLTLSGVPSGEKIERLNEVLSVKVGVPTPPVVLVEEKPGRRLILECNEILNRLEAGRA